MGHPRSLDREPADATDVGRDVALWAALRGGDADALTELFDRHATAVYNFAFRRTASWSGAEDVTQATFLTVWRRATRGDLPALEHASAVPWLLGVADHESRGLARTLWRRHRLQARLEATDESGAGEVDHADLVADRLTDERRMGELQAAVAGLPAHQRVVVELVVWSGLSLAEAATALGVAEGTVKSRLSRARRRLSTTVAVSPEGAR